MGVRSRAPAILAAMVVSLAAAGVSLAGSVTARVVAAPSAAAPPPQAPPQDPLSIYVMTFGPGDHPFFKFGHDAIWIHDAQAGTNGTDRVYNFGTFAFTGPRLILDFLHGRMTYWLSVSYLPAVLASYEHENRTIDVQELALDPAAKQALRARLDVNARPENRDYKYDYFLDNCATRVRDAIDDAVRGQLRTSAGTPARLTLRQQALRMTADYWPLYLALDIVLGPDADRPIDRWGEMFIPQELARGLSAVTLSGPNGTRPLVSEARAVFAAQHRPPPLETPPARARALFLAGSTVGLLFVLVGWAATRPHLASPARVALRALFGLLLAAWGLVTGFVGCFLVYVWAFTDHVVAHHNQNILLFAPWALALLVLGIGVTFGRPWAARGARTVALAALAAAIAAALLKVGIVRHQENDRLLSFSLPAWLGIYVTLVFYVGRWHSVRR
ncbi:MAG TPA: DUF4105 domain-containing protein [Polyangia bacterium]|jgi:hypothetical protein|nr:DUF4105 domain-containing protein [Polyangia bacterium]